ncbi:MAG: hypothetical protein QXM27_00275 [Candidatus Pacearchaeota archaeon]
MEKNIKNFILIYFLLSLIFIPFVIAQEPKSVLDYPVGPIKPFDWLFGFTELTTVGHVIIFVLLFLIFMFAFVDILTLTAPFFSRRTVYIISFGLSLLIALSRGLIAIARFLLSLASTMGVVAVVSEIIAAFVIFILLSWGSTKAYLWAMRRKVRAQALRGATGPAEAWQKLEQFQQLTKK